MEARQGLFFFFRMGELMPLRDYQQQAADAAWSAVRRKEKTCIVLPTGGGKSWVIAELCRQAREWDGRAIVLQHRKELVEQNAEKIQLLLPDERVGIYSAGLRKKECEENVVVAGIQSAFRRATDFGRRHVVIIDECHRIGTEPEGQYQQFLSTLETCNAGIATIGLSATPFRTGEGEITDGFFDSISYQCEIEPLIERGFLTKLINKPAASSVDMSRVQVRRGDFVQGQMEAAFMEGSHVADNVAEIQSLAAGRESIIIFCSGVAHAEAVHSLLGDDAGIVTGASLPLEREATLRRFKRGELRWLVNVNVLTEGFDSPSIDCVVMLRATVSPGLFAQAVGRGFRIAEGKSDCLVLDFGGNIARHGALNDPEFGRNSKKREGDGMGEAPSKPCLKCKAPNAVAARWCVDCFAPFPPPEDNLDESADTDNAIIAEPEWKDCRQVDCQLHESKKKPGSYTMRVDYRINMTERISEWVCVEHTGFAHDKALAWWEQHTLAPMPDTVEEALGLWDSGAFRVPARLLCRKEGRWWRVLDRDFNDIDRPLEWAGEDPWAEVPF